VPVFTPSKSALKSHRAYDVKDEEITIINRPSLAKFSTNNVIRYHNEYKFSKGSTDIYQIANDIFNTNPIQAIEFLIFLGFLKMESKSIANYVFFTQGLSKKCKSICFTRSPTTGAVMVRKQTLHTRLFVAHQVL
jgi:hypothetical protein